MQKTTRINPLLRKLLQLDQPVPVRPEAEVIAERDRNYRWNFSVNLGDVSSFWFGLSFISSATIVPLYISKLSASPIWIGLAAVLAQGAWYLPQLFTANFVEQLPRKKAMVVNLGLFTERLPLWIICLSPLAALKSPALALFIFFLGYAWHGLGAGLVATSWQDLLARCFPVHRRGRFMGLSFFVGSLIGVGAAGISAKLLADLPYPTSFFYSFAIAALAITVSWFFLAMTREPVEPVSEPPQSNRQFWQELPVIVRRDENYRHFLLARLLLALSNMGLGFITVAAIRRWAVADGTVGGYTAVFMAGQLIGTIILGLLADKHGHKLSLEIGALAAVSAFLLAWLAPEANLYFLVWILLGIFQAGAIVSGIPVVMEFSTPGKRPTYIGLANTGVGIMNVVGPILGAALALAGYNWLFLASAIFALASLILFRWRVQEPRFYSSGTTPTLP